MTHSIPRNRGANLIVQPLVYERSIMKRVLTTLTFALALGTAQAADIVDTAKSAGSFNTLVTAVQAAGWSTR